MPNRSIVTVIKHRDFLAVAPGTTVRQTARLMKQHHEAAVLVVAQEHLLGICTERDLTFDVLAEGLDPELTPVSDIMTTEPRCISPDKPFSHAMHLMHEGGFRHVPVVDEAGHPLGIVSSRDALGLEVLQFGQELERREELTEIL